MEHNAGKPKNTRRNIDNPHEKSHSPSRVSTESCGDDAFAHCICVVPDKVKNDYDTFMTWCRNKGIKDAGHTVATMISSKLRAKPINIEEFDEETFLQGSELDGSSFATGGGRVVHRSKVMAVPDRESKWFTFPDPVRRTSLCILSEMITPEGTPIGGRKPLRLASLYLEQTMGNLAKTLGLKMPGKSERFGLIAGFEKEFFIVPSEAAEKRPDLKYIGMTVVGEPGPVNQNLQGVYLTIPRTNEEALLADIVKNLATVGIVAVQKHLEVGQTGNELSGRQCEIVLKYAPALHAADNELIARQIIEDVCSHHGFRVLIGSKSFTESSRGDGINGSGKHTNMSLVKYNVENGAIVENLLSLKELSFDEKSPVNLIGLAMVAALGRHWPVYDAAIASRGNDLRRRPGYEAPVYLSAFIGSTAEFRDSPLQDRNRSVSIGLSGNKLEWRAPGANSPMYFPLAFVQMGMAEVLSEINERIRKAVRKGIPRNEAVIGECKRLRDEIDYFVVDEDVYELGKEDAERRFGYRAPENTFEAIQILDDKKNIEFLIQGGVFTEEMIRAFKMVQLENYVERVRAEARVTSHMAKVLGNKVLRSPLMSIPPHHLAEIEQRLRERQIYLGKLSADLIMKIDGSTLCDARASKGEDIRGLLVCLRKMDNYDEMALLVVSRLLPLLTGIRFIYEEIVEIIGGSEEVSRM